MSQSQLVSSPRIIAHRGASQDAPENTRAAIELAWYQGADAAEIDIHLSRSGEIIVMHDKNTIRTTGFDGEIAALTWGELKQLDAGAWKNPQFKGEAVPTLDDLLAALPTGKQLYIEIKTDESILEPLQTSLQKAALAFSQTVIIAFNHALLKTAKTIFPHTEVLWLCRKELLNGLGKDELASLFENTMQLGREANFDGLDLPHEWFEAEFPVNKAQDSGLKIYAYTVNNRALARHLAQLGVDGITTDCPGFINAQIGTYRESDCSTPQSV